MSDIVRYEHTDGVAVITLDRPDAMNSFTSQLSFDLLDALERAYDDDTVRVVLLTGEGRCFSAGADLKGGLDGRTVYGKLQYEYRPVMAAVASMPKPVIAMVAGYAIGGGHVLHVVCDLTIAADNAVFGQPEINLGIMPGAGGTQRLTRAVGKAKAMELCLTGRQMNAEEAERANLVSRVVPGGELLGEAMKVAAKIANLSQHAVMMIKEAINRGFATTLAEGTRFERGQFYSLFATEDQKEGMAAFIEKRKPAFTNR